jgi:sugar lactone lactonase YvrE
MATHARRDLRVAAAAFCFGAVTLFAQAPRIDSVSPSAGPIAGGTAVVLRGSNLAGAKLTVDNAAVAATVTAEEIRFTAPKHDNGYAILRAATSAGMATARFLYIPPALKDLPPGYITTIAGVGPYYGDFGPAREAALAGPWEIAYGPDGSLYIVEAHHNRVVRVRPDGILEPFAGDGSFPKPNNPNTGPALDAWFGYPRSLLVENNGDVIIADDDTNRIYRVDAVTGLIRPIAGTGAAGFSGDGGPATQARLNSPTFLAGDKAGTIWFIDYDNFRIRQITPDGKITTICGVGSPGFSGDGGPAIVAQFDIGGYNGYDAGGLAYDPAGFLYVSEAPNRRIRRINLRTGIIETFAGPERNFGARLDRVRTLMGWTRGRLVLHGGGIVRATREGQLVERFGSVRTQLTFDGTPLADVTIGGAIGLALDRDGNIVYTDEEIHRVMRLNRRTGLLETVAGIGPDVLGENGPALAASPVESTNAKPDLVVLPSGEVVFSGGPRIRKIGLDGKLSVVAFIGTPATFGEDIPATEASFNALGLDLDAKGNLFVATGDHVVYIDAQGFVRRFAGLLTPLRCDYTGDGGPARNGRLCQPGDVALDREGNAFIADTNNNRVRRVDAKTGVITTVAGSGPVNGWEGYHRQGSYCGDGGPATSACLDTPQYVAVNSQGELYIGESGRTRKVDQNGVISTVTDRGAGFMVMDATDNILAGGLGCGIKRLTPRG